MPMPETTMDEDDLSATGKHKIRLSGQVGTMQPETISEGVDQSAYCYFWLSVLAPDPRHPFAALFLA